MYFLKINNLNYYQKFASSEKSTKSRVLGLNTISNIKFGQLLKNNTEDINVNILILGFDARIGDKNPRCDAIHILSFYSKDNILKITSVPRGTLVEIPQTNGESSYIGNACHIVGVDYVISQIEKITGINPDYIVKSGFSQSMGVFRMIGLPANDTLQSLRARKKYALGDYQRSHNHALFMKELIINYTDNIVKIPKQMLYLIYKTIDTDIDFDVAYELINLFYKSNIHRQPERIILTEAPQHNKAIKDLKIDTIGKLSVADNNDFEFVEYQNKIFNNINITIDKTDNLLSTGNKTQAFQVIETPYKQKIWLQIENLELRNNLQFEMLRLYTQSSQNINEVTDEITAFLVQTDILGDNVLKQKTLDLLDNLQ